MTDYKNFTPSNKARLRIIGDVLFASLLVFGFATLGWVVMAAF